MAEGAVKSSIMFRLAGGAGASLALPSKSRSHEAHGLRTRIQTLGDPTVSGTAGATLTYRQSIWGHANGVTVFALGTSLVHTRTRDGRPTDRAERVARSADAGAIDRQSRGLLNVAGHRGSVAAAGPRIQAGRGALGRFCTSGRRRAGSFAACVRSSLPRRSRSHSSDSCVIGRVAPPGHGLDSRWRSIFCHLLPLFRIPLYFVTGAVATLVALVALVMPDGPAQTLVLGYGMGATMCMSGLWLGLTAERTSQRESEAPTSAGTVSATR